MIDIGTKMIIYQAIINQTGTDAPVVWQIQQNGFERHGIKVTWTYGTVGNYIMTFTKEVDGVEVDADILDLDSKNVACFLGQPATRIASGVLIAANQWGIRTRNVTSGVGEDGVLFRTPVRLELYLNL